MLEHINYLLGHYGYFGIILALVGGIVGLPIPDEVLLTYVGFTVSQGKMSYLFSLLSAFAGSIGGITFSYYIGCKFGLPFLKRFGPKFHISEEKINRTSSLFQKIGPSLLVIGYFIPGVRHLAAYITAMNGFSYKRFAIYAYTGAILWSFSFISLGKILGKNWIYVEEYMSKYSIYIIIIIFLVFVLIYYLMKKRNSYVMNKNTG